MCFQVRKIKHWHYYLNLDILKAKFEDFYVYMVGEGNGTALQYSCLENPVDGGAW